MGASPRHRASCAYWLQWGAVAPEGLRTSVFLPCRPPWLPGLCGIPRLAGGKTCRWKTTDAYRRLVTQEWACVVTQLHNHPSIIAWGPFNEFGPKGSWKYNHGIGGGFR